MCNMKHGTFILGLNKKTHSVLYENIKHKTFVLERISGQIWKKVQEQQFGPKLEKEKTKSWMTKTPSRVVVGTKPTHALTPKPHRACLKTWGSYKVVLQQTRNSCSNPTPISSFHDQTSTLLYIRGNLWAALSSWSILISRHVLQIGLVSPRRTPLSPSQHQAHYLKQTKPLYNHLNPFCLLFGFHSQIPNHTIQMPAFLLTSLLSDDREVTSWL